MRAAPVPIADWRPVYYLDCGADVDAALALAHLFAGRDAWLVSLPTAAHAIRLRPLSRSSTSSRCSEEPTCRSWAQGPRPPACRSNEGAPLRSTASDFLRRTAEFSRRPRR